jgi:hypothetical protein
MTAAEKRQRLAEVAAQEAHLARQIEAEAKSARRWIKRSADRMVEGFAADIHWLMIGAAMLAVGCVLGMWGQPMWQAHTQASAMYESLKTAIPIVPALNVDVDPGKYDGKLTDVMMTVTRGGVYKSGKGFYVGEHEGGMSIVVFESAFPAFMVAYGVTQPDQIVAHLMGKYIKARGTVRRFGTGDKARMSMVIFAPGLLTEIPEKP